MKFDIYYRLLKLWEIQSTSTYTEFIVDTPHIQQLYIIIKIPYRTELFII